ncbi:putative disease resistance protein At1g50180 [Manihot esculenta]|uniref:NB-ARC domain-containing protein n=1 Tax=Manihot esculenta TaxID=3983 RepID=A0A2C9VM69_MANES|nr:putative disease resistance protein At1g50180 [Manihot esculenta]OAY46155.1 hypothetical protein MANES_07G121300v8 [Manihot esculenta]
MTEAVVSVAVERIAELLIQKAAFLRGVRGEIELLQAELKRMKCLLKDADRSQHQDESVRNCVAEIRDLTYDAEDVIDTFLLQVARGTGEGVRGFIKRVSFKFSQAFFFYEIGTQITYIRAKIEGISASMQNYGYKLVEGESARKHQPSSRRSYPHAEEDDIIGFDAVISVLRAHLMLKEEQVRVVSIVGMRGLGKTTLAKKVYKHFLVNRHFDSYSWTFISQQISTKEILIGILMDVVSSKDEAKLETKEKEKEELLKSKVEEMKAKMEFKSVFERMAEEELIEFLYDVLADKRYFVVLDDIWTNEKWLCLRPAFPNGKRGSKVLLTTRNRDVASYADPSSPKVELPLLTGDEGWELLSRKAFPKHILNKHGYPPEFEALGKEMMKKCGGLPLAIIVLGALLATKSTLGEWQAVRRNINAQFLKWEQDHQDDGVYKMLALSYDDLPFHLKPCFLYLSQFPEGTEFRKRALIRMWIAEGFVAPPLNEEEMTIEDVAEEYCEELVSRCMVQVSQKDHTGTRVKTCSLHDIVRQMCITKARDENFLAVVEHRRNITADSWSSSSTRHMATKSKLHRIAIHPCLPRHDHSQMEFYIPSSNIGLENLRSLIFFVGDENYVMTKKQGISIFKNFRLLRVLNMEGVLQYSHCLPREIDNLIHLRYLGLKHTGLKDGKKYLALPESIGNKYLALPESIGNLMNLYTLDLRCNDYFTRLPDVLWKLKFLRHLLVDHKDYEHLRLHTLKNLETLKSVYAKNLIREGAMHKLTNLRNIGVYFQKSDEVGPVLKSFIFGSGRLRSLKMQIIGSFSNLEPLQHCNLLTKVELGGGIPECQPPLHHNLEILPPSLVKLILWDSNLRQDPMCILEKLPNLRFLSLENDAYQGSRMVCSATGFPQLETLALKSFGLEEWRIEEGAMPCLKSLSLSLEKLKMIPNGLKFVTTIRELKLIDMVRCEERVRVVSGVEGEDFDKVRRIPSISFK